MENFKSEKDDVCEPLELHDELQCKRVNLLPRPHLFERFNTDLRWKVTLVDAPPGSGKTCMLKEWNELYEKAFPGSRTKYFDRFDLDEPSCLESIMREIAAHRADGTPCFYLLDDFRFTGSIEAEKAFCVMVDDSPLNCRFVIAAAYVPHELYGMLASRAMQIVRRDLLMLTKDEFSRIMEMSFPDDKDALDSLDHLFWITEGWLMGLQLVLQMHERYPLWFQLDDFSGSNELVDGYFRTTVFNEMPRDLAEFSIDVSLARSLNPTLCDLITDRKDSSAVLRNLVRHNPFVFGSGKRNVYYCNRLYASWLHSQLLQLNAAKIRQLATNASAWYDATGNVVDKARMLIVATDANSLIPLCKGTKLDSRIVSSSDLLTYVLDTRLERETEKNPELCFLAVWAYIGFGLYDEIVAWVMRLERSTKYLDDEGERRYYLFTAEVGKAVAHSIRYHNFESIDQCDKLLRSGSPYLTSIVRFHLCYSLADNYERIGDLASAVDWCLQSNAHALAAGAVDYATFPNYKRCKILIQHGQFSEAETLAEESVSLTNDDSPLRRAFWILLALVQIESRRFDEARENIKRSQDGLTALKNPEVYIEAKLALVDLLSAQGEHEAAYEEILRIMSIFEFRKVPAAALGYVCIALGKVSLMRGSLHGIVTACEHLSDPMFGDDVYFGLYRSFFAACRMAFETNEDKVSDILGDIANTAHLRGFVTLFLEASVQKAVLLEGQGQHDAAAKTVQMVLGAGKTQGYRTTILNGGSLIVGLIEKVALTSSEGKANREYVYSLMKAAEEESEGYLENKNGLTSRELEILRMLNSGKSRQEISDTLCISINTTKTHIKNIRKKIG